MLVSSIAVIVLTVGSDTDNNICLIADLFIKRLVFSFLISMPLVLANISLHPIVIDAIFYLFY
jgi:hypothetical protein